tara:strand:- start:39 stop:263 length:225 start_codon:yes stop_codon:yes gene_type:complete
MIHYLVIGHACDEESEWQFTDSDKELTDDFLEQKFTKESLQELGYEPDEYESCGKEVYIDYILKSNSPIQIQYG